jgi:hypothetical protein
MNKNKIKNITGGRYPKPCNSEPNKRQEKSPPTLIIVMAQRLLKEKKERRK